jgi:hypothetical protein
MEAKVVEWVFIVTHTRIYIRVEVAKIKCSQIDIECSGFNFECSPQSFDLQL